MKQNYWLLVVMAGSLLGCGWVRAAEWIPIAELRSQLAIAEKLVLASQNDSALVVLQQLTSCLVECRRLESDLGRRTRLRYVEALERNQKWDAALELLLPLIDEAERQRDWSAYANGYITLELVHEQLENWAAARTALDRANDAVMRYQLDTIRPRLWMRTASFHRVQDSRDSAMDYARRSLVAARQYNRPYEEAISNVLLAMLYRGSDDEKSLAHFAYTGNYYERVGDYTGQMAILLNIARLHLRNGRPARALSYNDSALIASNRVVAAGRIDERFLAKIYQQRAQTMRTLGRVDSAWLYLEQGHSYDLAFAEQTTKNRVLEIEARYRDKQKAERIEQQALLIAEERQIRNWLIGIAVLIILLAVLLGYLYWRLRNAKWVTEAQARALRETNQELNAALEKQIMLQGEVHHRVKNNLQVIISLLEMQKEDIQDLRARNSLETMSGRIYSMAAIHEILYRKDGTESVDVSDYIATLCDHFANLAGDHNRPEFILDIAPLTFNLETLMPLGIMLNELLTNSLKYAALPGRLLAIDIRLRRCSDGYCLYYRDNGPGFPAAELRERVGGLGAYLLRSMTRQLNGRLVTRNEGGAVYEIFLLEKQLGYPVRERKMELQ